eukprot:gb/GECH01009728.1/.p1 GENE.gb/GECH01009728.1/~~gb/GECH01009728.1/.p1  ORF type:complete len:272 (+),score=38.20 gb/GECH01009728.1/:1-816(+)
MTPPPVYCDPILPVDQPTEPLSQLLKTGVTRTSKNNIIDDALLYRGKWTTVFTACSLFVIPWSLSVGGICGLFFYLLPQYLWFFPVLGVCLLLTPVTVIILGSTFSFCTNVAVVVQILDLPSNNAEESLHSVENDPSYNKNNENREGDFDNVVVHDNKRNRYLNIIYLKGPPVGQLQCGHPISLFGWNKFAYSIPVPDIRHLYVLRRGEFSGQSGSTSRAGHVCIELEDGNKLLVNGKDHLDEQVKRAQFIRNNFVSYFPNFEEHEDDDQS